MLASDFERRNGLILVTDDGKEYPKRIFKKENYWIKKYYGVAVTKCAQLKSKQGRTNAAVSVSGIPCVPFLLGKAKVIFLEELLLRWIDASKKEKITDVKKNYW